MQSIQIAASEIWISLLFGGILILFWKDIQRDRVTRMLLLACIFRLLSDALSWGFDGLPGFFFVVVTRISNYLTYVSNNVVSLLFSLFVWRLIRKEGEKPDYVIRTYWTLECLASLIIFVGAFFGWFYYFDSGNLYHRGPFYPATHITPVIALVVMLWMLVRYNRRFSRSEKALVWVYLILMSFATTYEYLEFGLSLQSYAQTFSAMVAFFMGEINIRNDLYSAQRNLVAANAQLEKAKDAAETANRAKSTFLFNMSHDIRTPMNAIVGYTELLLKDPDYEKRRDYLNKIRLSSDFLLSLINNVLEMARIESNNIMLDESPEKVGAIQDEVRAVYSELLRQKGIDFTATADFTSKYVFIDKVKAKSILLNIVSNAYKYTPKGGSVSFALKEIPCDRDGYSIIETVVSDTGIGMSKEYLPKLFDEFSRDRKSLDTQIQGTGLGMPIVKRLVLFMGGTIDVESEQGLGTTVTVRLPLRLAREEDLRRKSEQPVDVSQFEGKRILLAEDNDLNAEIAMEILGDLGFEIERAEDGIRCVDMVSRNAEGYYDLILMDIQMPNMNGYETTHCIREMQNKAKARIPIIAMTANAFMVDKKNAQEAGMDGHLSKPIEIDKVQSTLSEILKRGEN